MEILKKTSTNSNAEWIVLLHGYGASAEDLRPLADIIPLKSEANWLFPNGILEVPIGPQYMGRAWFPIDMEALQTAMMRGEHRKFSTIKPPGLKEAHEAVRQEVEKLGIPWSKVIIGGFSQGAMTAADLVLHLDESPLGLVLLSGALVNEAEWSQLFDKHKDLKVFQSHGRQDPVLSFDEAEALNELMKSKGISNQWIPFDGGHEIPAEALVQLTQFIQGRLPS